MVQVKMGRKRQFLALVGEIIYSSRALLAAATHSAVRNVTVRSLIGLGQLEQLKQQQ